MISLFKKIFLNKEKNNSKDAFGDFFKNSSPKHKKGVFMRVLKKVNEEQKATVKQYGR